MATVLPKGIRNAPHLRTGPLDHRRQPALFGVVFGSRHPLAPHPHDRGRCAAHPLLLPSVPTALDRYQLEFGFRRDQSVLGCPSVAGATVRATYGRRTAAKTVLFPTAESCGRSQAVQDGNLGTH